MGIKLWDGLPILRLEVCPLTQKAAALTTSVCGHCHGRRFLPTEGEIFQHEVTCANIG